jgi:hypothetical protein
MARVPRMARVKIPLARDIHCCPNSVYFFLPNQRLYIVRNMYIIYIYIYILYTSDWVEIVYEVPVHPNNTAAETFLHKSGAVRSVDWIFITGAPAWRCLGEYVTLHSTFYNILLKQEFVAAPVTSTLSSLSHSSRRPLFEMYWYYAFIKQIYSNN